MSKFIELEAKNGSLVSINVDNIACFHPSSDGCVIETVGPERAWSVVQSYGEVSRLISDEVEPGAIGLEISPESMAAAVYDATNEWLSWEYPDWVDLNIETQAFICGRLSDCIQSYAGAKVLDTQE